MDNFLMPAPTPVPRYALTISISPFIYSPMASFIISYLLSSCFFRSPSEMSQINCDIMGFQPGREPEVQKIRLVKSNNGMGLSIVAAKGVGKDRLGIYIKAVVEGGASWHDGRLKVQVVFIYL